VKYRDWIFLLTITSLITILSNLIGYKTPISESIPGVLILAGIALAGVILGKVIPLKLPMILYVSMLGLLLASPVSPVSKAVIEYTSKISFMAPVTVVGAFAGISMGKDFQTFKEQSWRMLIVGILVFTGTFVLSAIVAQVVLSLTGAI